MSDFGLVAIGMLSSEVDQLSLGSGLYTDDLILSVSTPSHVELRNKVYSLIKLDEPVNSPFTRPPEQRWLLQCSWFSKFLAHFARLPYPRSSVGCYSVAGFPNFWHISRAFPTPGAPPPKF